MENSKEENPSPNVFKYEDYRAYLSDYYESQKKQNPDKFSFRYFSRIAKFNSSNFLYLVIQGKRNLTLDSMRKIAQVIPLKGRPYKYFENLTLFNQAKSSQEKARYFDELKTFNEYVEARVLAQDQNVLLHQWYYVVILQMVKWPDFKPDPVWISSRLQPKVGQNEIKGALALLQKAKLVSVDKEGRWIQAHTRLETKPQNLGCEAISYHQQMVRLGYESLKRPANDRNVGGMTLSISPAHFEVLRQKIQDYQKELNEVIQKKYTAEELKEMGVAASLIQSKGFFDVSEVCQINFQLFKVAKNSGESNK